MIHGFSFNFVADEEIAAGGRVAMARDTGDLTPVRVLKYGGKGTISKSWFVPDGRGIASFLGGHEYVLR
jgi:hypothetical protein